jgi:hypothetical protein
MCMSRGDRTPPELDAFQLPASSVDPSELAPGRLLRAAIRAPSPLLEGALRRPEMRPSSGSSPEIRPSCDRLVSLSSSSSPEMRRISDSEMRISAPEMSPEMRRASSSFYLVGSSPGSVGTEAQAEAQAQAQVEAVAVEEEERRRNAIIGTRASEPRRPRHGE